MNECSSIHRPWKAPSLIRIVKFIGSCLTEHCVQTWLGLLEYLSAVSRNRSSERKQLRLCTGIPSHPAMHRKDCHSGPYFSKQLHRFDPTICLGIQTFYVFTRARLYRPQVTVYCCYLHEGDGEDSDAVAQLSLRPIAVDPPDHCHHLVLQDKRVTS